MRGKKFLVMLLVMAFSLSFLTPTYAVGDVSLNPSDGTIDATGKSIDIVIDSAGQEVNGIELSVTYEGEVSFAGFTSGNIAGCEVDGLERDTEEFQDIFLYCFILTDPYTDSSGVFATLDFESTGEGYAEVRISDVEGVGDVTTGGIGSYTTTLSTSTQTPTTTESSTTLPNTSSTSTSALLAGISFLSITFFLTNGFQSKPRSSMSEKLR